MRPIACTVRRRLAMDSAGFQWKLRRSVDRVVAFVAHRTTRPYPKTNAALNSLLRALSDEMPLRSKRRIRGSEPSETQRGQRGRIFSMNGRASKKHYDRARRLQKENEKLRADIAKHTVFKDGNYRNEINPEWLVRTFLSHPNPSARGTERSVRDVVGMDVPVISRKSTERIRDAWVTMYKPMVLNIVAHRLKAIEAGPRHVDCEPGWPWFVPWWFLLVQDEADLKLRSREDDGHDVLRRSRASKVQQNVLKILDVHGSTDIPTELEPLGDKSSATLATSFERLLRSTVSAVLPANCGGASPATLADVLAARPERWLFHVVVGDGIPTNEAAAKRLWKCVQAEGLGAGIRYFLVVVVCGTHQAGLAAKSAVLGRAAKVAGKKLYVDIIGVSVRLYKYLMNDYYDEFVFSVNEWVVRCLEVLPAEEADATRHARTLKLRELYTEHVLLDNMLELFNNGIGHLSHVVSAGQVPGAERPRLVREFVQFIVRHLMHVDSAPR